MPDSSTPARILSSNHVQWLEERRHIPGEIAVKAGLYSEGEALTFPYGTYSKLRMPDKSFRRAPAGTPTELWRIATLGEATGTGESLFITEGEIDALSLMTAGVPWVVSVPDGAQHNKPGEGDVRPNEDKSFAWLWQGGRIHPDIAKFDRIVLCTDADQKGHILRGELAVRLGRFRCWAVAYPEGCKDANDVLAKHGAAELAALLAAPIPLIPDVLLPLPDIPTTPVVPLHLGTNVLTQHMRIVRPELCVITGQPGAGKSEFAIWIGLQLARLHGIPGAIIQLEDNVERLKNALLRYANAWERKGGSGSDAVGWVREHIRAVGPQDNDDERGLPWLMSTIEEAARRHGCGWVIVDPWNEVEHFWDRSQTEATYLNDALLQLKRLSRRCNLALFIVCHPTKSGVHKDIADMSLYDCAGAAAWKNKADHGIIVHREDQSSNIVKINIDKSKDHARMGVPGIVTMRLDLRSGCYVEAG